MISASLLLTLPLYHSFLHLSSSNIHIISCSSSCDLSFFLLSSLLSYSIYSSQSLSLSISFCVSLLSLLLFLLSISLCIYVSIHLCIYLSICLFNWLSISSLSLSKITNRYARNLVSLLLSKDPKKRPSLTRVMEHPFLTNKRCLLPIPSVFFFWCVCILQTILDK